MGRGRAWSTSCLAGRTLRSGPCAQGGSGLAVSGSWCPGWRPAASMAGCFHELPAGPQLPLGLMPQGPRGAPRRWSRPCVGRVASGARASFPVLVPRVCRGTSTGSLASHLENPRDRGAWWAAVYGVTQSRTRLTQLSSSGSSRRLVVNGRAGIQILI